MEPLRPPYVPPDHDVRRAQRREQVRNGLWVIPSAFIVGAVALALALHWVDGRLDRDELELLFDGDVGSAQSLLATIAGTVMTFTSLLISVTLVALQLASQQFSPRVLRTFFRDTGTKVALGLFIGTFVYNLTVLRQIEPAIDSDVPRLSITVAFVLALLSLGVFVWFVDHVVHAIRIVSIVDAVAAETRAAIREVHVDGERPTPDEVPDRAPDLILFSERAPGAITTIDEDDLVAIAAGHRCLVRFVPRIGQYVPSGAPLVEVWSDDDGVIPSITAAEVLPHVGLHRERTMTQDAAFGFRQLVDIAEKALSPAVNDPTTAVQVLDRIHDLLRRVAVAPEPSGYHRDERGRLRLVLPVARWDALVGLACDEIRLYGGSSHQVQRKMRSMLDDLLEVVDEPRREPLERQRRLLDAAAKRHFADDEDLQSVQRSEFEP